MIYKHSLFFKIAISFGSLMFTAFAFLPLYSDSETATIPVVSLFAFFAIFSIKAIPEIFSQIHITENGMKRVFITKKDETIYWNDIFSLKDNQFLQKLIILNKDGKKLFEISHAISNFFEIKEFINKNSKNLKVQIHTTFKASKGGPIVFLTIGLFFNILGFYFLSQGDNNWFYFNLFSLLTIFVLFSSIKKLTLNENHLDIFYLFGKQKVIKYSEIDEVELENETGEYNTRSNVVNLLLGNGEEVKLKGFQEGEESLYKSLVKVLNFDEML